MIRVQSEPFSPGAELDRFLAAPGDAGACVSFIGRVRARGETGDIGAMTLEHYPGMTERELARLEADARARWSLEDVLVIHRHGTLKVGEPIVLVLTRAAHRGDAFAAAAFLMDYLKTRAPFWKAESGADGPAWVEAKDSDDAAAARWKAKD